MAIYTISSVSLPAVVGRVVTLSIDCVVSGRTGGPITHTANVYLKLNDEPEELVGLDSETIL